jgi:hypothetical protein
VDNLLLFQEHTHFDPAYENKGEEEKTCFPLWSAVAYFWIEILGNPNASHL